MTHMTKYAFLNALLQHCTMKCYLHAALKKRTNHILNISKSHFLVSIINSFQLLTSKETPKDVKNNKNPDIISIANIIAKQYQHDPNDRP